jgi:hypothetical protein
MCRDHPQQFDLLGNHGLILRWQEALGLRTFLMASKFQISSYFVVFAKNIRFAFYLIPYHIRLLGIKVAPRRAYIRTTVGSCLLLVHLRDLHLVNTIILISLLLTIYLPILVPPIMIFIGFLNCYRGQLQLCLVLLTCVEVVKISFAAAQVFIISVGLIFFLPILRLLYIKWILHFSS